MASLPRRQQQVLEFLRQYIKDHEYPPALREIASHLEVEGTQAVIRHLDALAQKGFIKREGGRSRGIVLVQPEQAEPHAVAVPVVGSVQAGTPRDAIEIAEGMFSIDESQVGAGAFFLKVKGDSMINASILEGDLALVVPERDAKNRSIVVAMINGEATLKRFFREGNRIRLQPENPDMPPIILTEASGDVSIIGKVVGIYRAIRQ